jgi:phage shock protein PspC (stress-responsive transcriptional regulator)
LTAWGEFEILGGLMTNGTTNRITRSRSDRMIAGVCGGLAEYLRIDVTLVRLFFVLLALGEGIGILLYVILWLIMPDEEVDRRIDERIRQGATEMGQRAVAMGNEVRRAATHPNSRTIVLIGAVLIFLGAFYLMDNLNIPGLQWLDVDLLWPLLLIIGGVALIVRQRERE